MEQNDPPKTESPAKAPGTSWLAVAGVVAIFVGIATLLSNYLFLPLQAGSWRTAVTGLGIGCVMGGIRMLRQAEVAQSGRMKVALWCIIPILFVGCMAIMWGRMRPAAVTLTPKMLPGFSISLPDWAIEHEDTDFNGGEYKMSTAQGELAEVRWIKSEPVSLDNLRTIFNSIGPEIDVKRLEATMVEGHSAETLQGNVKAGAHYFFTYWHCPRDGRGIFVATMLRQSYDDALAIHRNILQSVKCHTMSIDKIPTPLFPVLNAPSEFEKTESSNELTFASAHCSIAFPVGMPGRKLADEVTNDEKAATAILRALLTALLQAKDIQVDPKPRVVKDSAGQPRTIWFASAVDPEGDSIRVQMVVWYCEPAKVSFIGLGLIDSEGSVEKTTDLLLSAKCPR
jgi:hypothetical protein